MAPWSSGRTLGSQPKRAGSIPVGATMKVIIDKEVWSKIKKHATQSFPEECVGFFLGCNFNDSGEITVVEAYPCDNISKDKRHESMVSRKKVRKLMKECENLNKRIGGFFIGQYHSHPTTGNPIQSEVDQAVGRKWKVCRFQLILGLKRKRSTLIRKKFHYYDRKNKVWQEGKIVVEN